MTGAGGQSGRPWADLPRGAPHLKLAVSVNSFLLTGDAVVAVAERGDLFTAQVVAQVVEPAEEVVEQPHELRRRLVRAHLGEAHDVREQDAHVLHGVHVEGAEDVADVALRSVHQQSTSEAPTPFHECVEKMTRVVKETVPEIGK